VKAFFNIAWHGMFPHFGSCLQKTDGILQENFTVDFDKEVELNLEVL